MLPSPVLVFAGTGVFCMPVLIEEGNVWYDCKVNLIMLEIKKMSILLQPYKNAAASAIPSGLRSRTLLC